MSTPWVQCTAACLLARRLVGRGAPVRERRPQRPRGQAPQSAAVPGCLWRPSLPPCPKMSIVDQTILRGLSVLDDDERTMSVGEGAAHYPSTAHLYAALGEWLIGPRHACG